MWRDLGGPRLPWGRLVRLINQLPEHARTHRSIHGDDARWTMDRHLMAMVVDALHAANWQRSGDSSAQRPKPIPRPGVESEKKRYGGGTKLSQAEVLAVLKSRIPKRGTT